MLSTGDWGLASAGEVAPARGQVARINEPHNNGRASLHSVTLPNSLPSAAFCLMGNLIPTTLSGGVSEHFFVGLSQVVTLVCKYIGGAKVHFVLVQS
jgi:hypothetical protein